MKCKNCGYNNKDNSNVCYVCGTILDDSSDSKEEVVVEETLNQSPNVASPPMDISPAKKNKSKKKLIIIVITLVCISILGVFGIIKFKEYSDEKAIQEKRNSYALILNDANCAVDSNQLTEAEELYKSAINLDPTLSAAYFGLSKVYELKGDPTSAKLILEKGYLATGDPLLF